MKTIHKYYIPAIQGEHKLITKGVKSFLTAQEQNDNIVIWAMISSDYNFCEEINIIINVEWTGQPNKIYKQRYLSTVQTKDGLVHHIFVPEGY